MHILYRTCLLLYSLFTCCAIVAQESEYRIEVAAVPLTNLIDQLEKSYDVTFSYPSDLLEDQVFYLKTNTPDLSDILNEITAIYQIEYQVLSNQSILLREKLEKTVSSIEIQQLVNISIVDKESQLPLEHAALGIAGTAKGDYTDKSGALLINIDNQDSNTSFEIHLLGYQKKKVTWNKKDNQKIELTPSSFSIEEVMIQDRGEVLKVNRVNQKVELSTQHISSLASGVAGNDVLRQAQLLPGVAAFDDQSSGLKIRGSDDASSLIILDDIPIYNASHYYGLFSSINPNYASTSTLYKNNLPVSYDGKTAGMLQVNGPKNGSSTKASGAIDMNLLTLSGNVSLPITQNLSLTFAARTTYQNPAENDLFSLFANQEEKQVQVQNFSLSSRDNLLSSVPDFNFFDVVGKFRYVWNKSSLEFNYYQSEDDLDDSFTNEFISRRERREITNRESYSNTELWKNKGYNIKFESQLTENTFLSTMFYSTRYDNVSGLSVGLTRLLQQDREIIDYNNLRQNAVRDQGLKTTLNIYNGQSKLSAGVEIVEHAVGILITEKERDIVDDRDDRLESSTFISYIPSTTSKLQLELGLRATHYVNKIYPSPRLNISYSLSDETTLKSSIGRHNQFVRELTFENVFGRSLDLWILANDRRFKVSSADQLMIGGTYKKNRFTLDIESYYRKRFNLMEQALTNARFNQTTILPNAQGQENSYEIFTGEGNTLGIDATIGVTYPKYSGWLTYTLSKSIINYDQIRRNESFPTQDDRRHQVKWINEYRIGKFTLGANLIYASGKPYTDLNKVVSMVDRRDSSPGDRISRLPYYLRTDLAVTYQLVFPQNTVEVGLSAYNLLNRQNVSYIQYLYSLPTNTSNEPSMPVQALLGAESSLLNRTVNLSLKVGF